MQSGTSTLWRDVRERYGNTVAFIASLRMRLAATGKTQAALAARAGVSPAHVSRWFTHKITPTLDTLVMLDEALYQLETHEIEEGY